MDDLPDIVSADAIAIALELPPFYQDHHVAGRPVLPAVEAMELLAAQARRQFPVDPAVSLKDLRFDKFLFLDAPGPPIAAVRFATGADGARSATLSSRFTAPGAAITRTLTHAALILSPDLPPAPCPPLDLAACLTGVVMDVDPERIYREMVPFGPAYRNIRRLSLSADGALARVASPAPPDPRQGLCLGSPYVLDAAFHAACVWCQRFGNTVAFPVAIGLRAVVRPTRLDEAYTARIVPARSGDAPFVFDIFIHDDAGRLREAALGVQMRDVSGGRRTPPAGFWQPATADALASLASPVTGLVLVERGAVAECAALALSDDEKRRLAPMTPTRAGGYISARLALKRLSRRLSGDNDPRPAQAIETVAADGQTPQCPLADGGSTCCSVAHDNRFTVAVAAQRPVGVDVEPVSEKALGGPDLFMDEAEQTLVGKSPLDRAGAALRVWSVKESAAKAARCSLAEAWQRVRVTAVGVGESRLTMDGRTACIARHALVDGHLFTLLVLEERP